LSKNAEHWKAMKHHNESSFAGQSTLQLLVRVRFAWDSE
jgi:hypothetical protein